MKTLLLLFLGLIIFFLTSCNKCDPSNSIGGLVVEDAIVRVVNAAPSEPLFITASDQVNFDIEYSLDNGLTYNPVDFSQYSVLTFPTTANCSSGYERIVERDDANEIVVYTINITQCDNCQSQATISNWVLVPAIPNNYSAVYKLDE
jgi:hypothetical protein